MTSSRGLAGKHAVFVLAYADIGGAENAALVVARHLAKVEGMDVTICALTDREGRARDAAEAIGIDWATVPVRWSGGRAAKARELAAVAWGLRRLRPDVLLPFTGGPNVMCGLTWRATGARACIWNQLDVAVPRRFGRTLLRRSVRSTPIFVACAEHVAGFLQTTFELEPARIRVIPYEVVLAPPRSSRAEWRAKLGLDSGAAVACMVANLHKHKDHETMLRAWRRVLDRPGADAERVLLLAGRAGDTEHSVKALAYDLELGRSVRFLGDVDDVSGLLSASDVGVLSSRAEGLSLSVREYMLASLSVAGTDIPGIREALPPEQHMFLSPVGDADGLASVLLRLFDDRELRARLGQDNARHARCVLAPEQTTDVYAAMLAERL